MDNFQTFRFQSHDFDEISASLSRWDQTYRQLSAGPFFGDVEYLQIDGMEIFELHWGQVIHYQGLTPPGTIGFGLPLTFTGESRYLNRPVSNGQLLIQQCGSEGDLIGSRNFKIQVLTVNEQRFLNKVASTTGGDSRQLLRNISTITLSPGVTETLRRKFQTLIHNAHHHFRHRQVADNIRLLAEDLLDSITDIVISGNFEQTKSCLQRQQQLVKKAEDFVWSYPVLPPRYDTMCANLGTSERSLRYAFKACTGMSAGTYLKAFRLNQVRSELKTRSPQSTRVQDVAFGWGFSHMGQFAADYKRLFGEPPSETLRRGYRFQSAVS